jgi:hypothetical protein
LRGQCRYFTGFPILGRNARTLFVLPTRESQKSWFNYDLFQLEIGQAVKHMMPWPNYRDLQLQWFMRGAQQAKGNSASHPHRPASLG